MTPVPLLTAAELRPLARILTSEDRATLERFCELNRGWIDKGQQSVTLATEDVRRLLTAALRMARECLAREELAAGRAQLETLPESAPHRCPICHSIMHLEFGRLRCRLCNAVVPDSEEGGP